MSRIANGIFVPYPRTPHLQGSGIQKGDDGRHLVTLSSLQGYRVVLEEKVDASNAGFGFDAAGDPFLQSRGHLLDVSSTSVHRERQFNLMKLWINAHRDVLLDRLEDRFIVYCEWMGATHSIFYNRLPHFVLEFDVLDRHSGHYLDTPGRRELLQGLPLASVPVVGIHDDLTASDIEAALMPSLFRSRGVAGQDPEAWMADLRLACERVGDDYARRLPKLFRADASEGVYGKVEQDGVVVGRFKFVKPGFVQTILDADEHWHNRILIPNLLQGRVDIFPDAVVSDVAAPMAGYDPDAPFAWTDWAEDYRTSLMAALRGRAR